MSEDDERVFERFQTGIQLSGVAAVALSAFLATSRSVDLSDSLRLEKMPVDNRISYSLVMKEGSVSRTLVVKPLEKQGGVTCIVMRASETENGNFRTLHDINKGYSPYELEDLTDLFKGSLGELVSKYKESDLSRGRGA